MTGVELITFGCRLNAFESEVIRRRAEAAGLADAVIVNTCAVTAEAERQARQAIRRARRDNPDARIIVTGCAAQIAPERWAAMAEVDRVIGNAEKLDPAIWRDDAAVRVNDIMSVRETAGHLVEGLEGRTRAFVQVQNGCDHRCTFCIIPYGRGNSRSVPVGTVVRQAQALVGAGYREIVLTGVDLTSYGADLIAGFPTEPDAMFENTLRLVEDCDLTWLHVFPYSPRTGTPAARMPLVPGVERKARAAALRDAGAAAVGRHLAAQAGHVLPVLMETDGLGRTPHFAPVAVARAEPGALVPVRMTRIEDGRLLGEPLPEAA